MEDFFNSLLGARSVGRWTNRMASHYRASDVELAFAQPNNDGSFPLPYHKEIRSLGRKRPVIMLAFAPKAAGTFLRSVLVKLVDGQLVRMVHAQGGRDAQPYLPFFVAYYSGHLTAKTLVTHLHMQALAANTNFMDAFGIRPVIMLRNIPDMLASYWDMVCSSSQEANVGLNVLLPDEFKSLPRCEQSGILLDLVAPWYISYYASWHRYTQRAKDKVLVLRYPDLLDTPLLVIRKIAAHSGILRSEPECRNAYEQVWSKRAQYRFNQGVSGRGSEYFGAAQLERLSKLLGHYPELNEWAEVLLGKS